MPTKKTACKEIRKSKLRHFKNTSTRSEVKTMARSFEHLVTAKKFDEAKKALANLVSKIDKAASKGVMKKNAASRKISRLMKKLSKLSTLRPSKA